ncbi:MAG: quinone oxidoreductase [Pseudomonadota bacterium]
MAYAMVANTAGNAGVFKKQDTGIGRPRKGQLVIKHTAIGLNFIDVYQRSGLYPAPGGYPAVLGCEAAGIVDGIGAGTQGFRLGDRVAYTIPGGSYCSHRMMPADQVVKIPTCVSDEVAAGAMLKGLTAQYLIHDCYRPRKGDTVLVHAAAGGVGLIVGQWLADKGIECIGTAGGKAKCKLASEAGYTRVIDYQKDNFVAKVLRMTQKVGVAAVYDSVGKDTYPGSLEVLRKFGTFVAFGQSSGVPDFQLADLSVHGSLHATRPTLFHFISNRQELTKRSRQLFKMIAEDKIKIQINQTYSLRDVAKAHRDLEGRKTTGQTILIP